VRMFLIKKIRIFKLFCSQVYSGEQNSFSHAVALGHSCFLSLYHCNTLQHASIHTATHSNTVTLAHSCVFSLCRCNILQHTVVLSSAATHCNTLLQHTLCDSLALVLPLSLSLQRTAIHTATHKLADSCCLSLCHCNTLQHATATHCCSILQSRLQHTKSLTRVASLSVTATHCNTLLQHTAAAYCNPHCNTQTL